MHVTSIENQNIHLLILCRQLDRDADWASSDGRDRDSGLRRPKVATLMT